ncbi:hypothetical protein [Horticoccus sp. 23ND18S-11]|uniref:hypothetical protein n=1 Tax=Horticoccus sp. 23ND18S-11 TaxID=3391832 RepID=UPI0039C93860
MPSKISVVSIGPKVCRPFVLEIMVFSPESGYKFKVNVERSCTPEADAMWKLVFDLFQLKPDQEVPLVHVSFTAGSPVEEKAIQQMVSNGVTSKQADVLVKRVFPAAKELKPGKPPTATQKTTLKKAMADVVNVEL